METRDIDKLIKSRVQQTSDLYQKEMDAAKPFVWSAVQNNLSSSNHITRWQLVAAVMAILMIFSLVFYSGQQKHQQELDLLYTKMDQIQQQYDVQTHLLETKELQLDSVRDQLNQLVLNTENLPQPVKIPIERLIHKVDTVFIRQIEYVRVEPEPEVAVVQNSMPAKNEIDQVIFPSQKSSVNNQRAEPIRVQLGSFTARKD